MDEDLHWFTVDVAISATVRVAVRASDPSDAMAQVRANPIYAFTPPFQVSEIVDLEMLDVEEGDHTNG